MVFLQTVPPCLISSYVGSFGHRQQEGEATGQWKAEHQQVPMEDTLECWVPVEIIFEELLLSIVNPFQSWNFCLETSGITQVVDYTENIA